MFTKLVHNPDYSAACRLLTVKYPKLNTLKRHLMERVAGIEPAYSAWKADVLPLNYTRRDQKNDLPKSKTGVGQNIRLTWAIDTKPELID